MFETPFTYPAVLARYQTGPGRPSEGAISRIVPAKALLARPCCVLPANCL